MTIDAPQSPASMRLSTPSPPPFPPEPVRREKVGSASSDNTPATVLSPMLSPPPPPTEAGVAKEGANEAVKEFRGAGEMGSV